MFKKLPDSPTTSLQPLKKLDQYSASQLSLSIDLLRALYLPEVRGTSLTVRSTTPTAEIAIDSGYASEVSDDESVIEEKEDKIEEAWCILRADEFERAFAIKWITGFVARGEEWAEYGAEEGNDRYDDRIKVIEDAASLLAACAGTSASGPIVRTFEFSRGGNIKQDAVVVHLRDASLLSGDHTSVGLQTWGSSCLLARDLVMHPSKYSLQPWYSSSSDQRLRVLELGAGTGLLSLALGKILHNTDIIASDFHDAVLSNLRSNVASNFPPHLSYNETPPEVHPLDWEHVHDISLNSTSCNSVLEQLSSPFDAPFDVIVGADIIYEPAHSEWIKSCLKVFLRRPEAEERFFFHLIMPLRPTHEVETASVTDAFPSVADVLQKRGGQTGDNLELAIVNVEPLERLSGTGRVDEVQYLLYRIGWV